MGIEGTYLNIVKAIYDKPMANIILSGEKLKAFPVRSRVSTFTTIMQHRSGSPSYSSQRKMKGIQIRKEVKLSLFADDMILYIENPKDSIKNCQSQSVNLAKFQDTKSIHRNPLHFCILTMKNQKEKLRNQSHSPLQQKN